MKKVFLSILAAGLLATGANAQMKVGASGAPSSTLEVRGSIEGNYNLISADATLGTGDYYTAYNTGASGGTITLPTSTLGTANFGGRVYHIKNTGTGNLIVAAQTGELIDNQAGAGVSSITLPAGSYAMIVNKGAVLNTTIWEVALIVPSATTACVPDYILSQGPGSDIVIGATPTILDFTNTNASSGITNTAGAYSLQAGKTYRLEASYYARTSATGSGNGSVNVKFYDASGTPIAGNSPRSNNGNILTSQPGEGTNSTAVAYYTPTTNTTVTCRAINQAGTCSIFGVHSYINIQQVSSCNGGGTTAASILSQIGYLFARYPSSAAFGQSGLVAGSDITINTALFARGGVSINSSGVVTLLPNKTYLLQGALDASFSIAEGFLTYSWVDATTNAVLSGGTPGQVASGTRTGFTDFTNPNAQCIITTGATGATVKLRAVGNNGSVIAFSGSGGQGASYLTVQEL